jgi:carboxyl-terminal processing protease
MSETSGFGGDSEQEIQKEPFATGTSFGFEDGTATGRDEGQPISRGRRIKRGRLVVLLVATVFIASASYSVGYLVSENQHPQSLIDQAINRISSGDPHSPTEILLQRAAIEAVLKATKDRWSNYFPPATATAFDATLQGKYSGIGIWLRRNTYSQLEIASVQPNSPAAHAGIKVGDQLLTVDGANIAHATVADAIGALRGNPNTDVQLEMSRNATAKSVVVTRASVLTGDVLASQIAPKTLYIQVSAISLHSADDVATALSKYPHTRGVILDLRDNPGGVLSEAVTLASDFLSPGPIVSYSRKDGEPQILSSTNSNPDTAPMVVLINGKSASSAEIIAGALQDRNRAVIIGDQSYGKGTVQEITSLSDGSQLEITVGQYHLPSGRAIDQVGITPDLKVAENKVISQGISILAGLVALDSGSSTTKKK